LRERAIRLVLDIEEETGNTTAACRRIGEELGINSDTLRGWVKRAQVDSGKRPGTTSADAARIRQLERENTELCHRQDQPLLLCLVTDVGNGPERTGARRRGVLAVSPIPVAARIGARSPRPCGGTDMSFL
jgi:transposase-like protein